MGKQKHRQAVRTVEDLFSAAPPPKVRKTAKALIGTNPSGTGRADWPELYAPKSQGGLAVHKKKIEVRHEL